MATVRDDSLAESGAQALAVSETHLHLSIEHYHRLLSQCLTDSEPSQRHMASVYRVLKQERRALLMAVEAGCPERCLDYLDVVSELPYP